MKFPSMFVDTARNRRPAHAVVRDAWVTPLRRVLRTTTLDELLKLISIFKGDICLVCQRALRTDEKEAHDGAGARLRRDGLSRLRRSAGRSMLECSM